MNQLLKSKANELFIILVLLSIYTTFFHFTTNDDDWNTPGDLSKSWLNLFYFTSTTFSSMGFGDITPDTSKAKILVNIVQMSMVINILALLNSSMKIVVVKTLIFLSILVVFAIVFKFGTSHNDWNIEKNDFTFENMYYFASTAFSTSGYGDIYPTQVTSKVLVILMQVILMLGIADTFFPTFEKSINKLKLL